MTSTVDRIVAHLDRAELEPVEVATSARTSTGSSSARSRPRGRPPALTPAQVASIRRRRALPLARRPRIAELAAELRVTEPTIRAALYGRPPYASGEFAEHAGGPHRDRGSGRFWPDL